MWKDIPVPVYERYYFFNITNPIEVERFAAKPKLKEIGPFTYRLYLNKTGIKFNDNGTVTFREKKTWIFLRDLSVAEETQIITTLNVPLSLTLTLLQSATPAVRVVVNLALEAVTEGFFIKRSVKQLLFEGYPDILTTFAPLLNPQITSYANGRFAWFNGKNATDDGLYNIFSGADDMHTYTMIDRWQNKKELPHWLTPECNSFADSTNGEMRPPLTLGVPQSLRLFHPDLCRVVNLDYNNTYESDVAEGITAFRYTLSNTTFLNSIDYPPNACYDTKYVRPEPSPLVPQSRIQSFINGLRRSALREGRENLPSPQSQAIPYASGVFDISKCKFGVPIVVSAPHFLGANSYYRSVLEGMTPDESKHNFWMDVEPATGTTIGLAARVQINVAINKGPGFRYRNIPNIVFPAFWQEMKIELNQEVASHLWLAAHIPTILTSVFSYSLYSIGGLLVITALILAIIQISQAGRFKTTDHGSDHAKRSTSRNNNKRNSQVRIFSLLSPSSGLSFHKSMSVTTNPDVLSLSYLNAKDDNRNILSRQRSVSDTGFDNPVPVRGS